MNLSNESPSMNVFPLRGKAFTPNTTEPVKHRESDGTTRPTTHGVKLSRRNLKPRQVDLGNVPYI
jgi:hypothetical protein